MSGDKQKNSSSSRDMEEKGLYGFKLPAVKLTTTNWLSWSKMVSTRLKGYRRHHHLVADPPKPLTDEWEADDSLILSAMWDAMEAGVRDTVMQCSTARKCWQKLEMNYSGLTSLTHAYDVLQAYNRPSMGSKTHDEYWTGFQKSLEELEELFPLTDLETVRRHREQIHVMNYLSGLPDSFSQARPSVMSHPLARGNVVEAYKLLRDMYPTQFAAVTSVEPLEASALFTTQFRKDGRGGGGGRVGFHNRGKGRGGRGGDHTSKGDLGIECHYCHQKGHMKWDCPRARTARTPPSSAHVASTSNLFSGTLDEDETRMIQEHRAQSSLLSSTACIAQTDSWGIQWNRHICYPDCQVLWDTGNEEKLAACKNLGADICINYKTEDFVARIKEETGGKGVDVILDSVGGAYFQRNLDSLSLDGRLFIIGFLAGTITEVNLSCMLAKRLTVQGAGLRSRSNENKAEIVAEVEKKVWPAIESGEVKPVIYKTLPLSEAAEAHRMMENSTHIGKILLVP